MGSFGLECLSRGALFVLFYENYPNVLPILVKNLENLFHNDKSQILNRDIFLEHTFSDLTKKFDIIFLDPPYKEKKLNILFRNIIKYKILKKEGVIILHRHKKEKDDFPEEFNILKVKTYGISKIIFGKI